MRVSFMIVGVQKGGTTTLHAWLSQHPGLVLSRPMELQFFDNEAHFVGGKPPLALYHASFPDDGKAAGAPRGEATPSYVWWPGTLERIQAYNPDARLIVLLRCPAER